MALLQVNFMSEALMRSVPMQVILPVDKVHRQGEPKPVFRPMKTLYLLHGIYGNDIDWVSGTNIQRWAEARNLAVVMPSGDNSFYLDHDSGFDNYGRFVGEELVEVTRRMFHLSERREDTFIGGLSMGGYGAIRNGLKYHENFGRIIAFSSALVYRAFATQTFDEHYILASRKYAEHCFGRLDEVDGSDKDVWALIRMLQNDHAEIPKFLIACGADDPLLAVNREYAGFLEERGVDVTFEVGEGAHDWDFWHRSIKRALDWLPVDGQREYLNSGNVTGASV